jgi:hypothetical protein
LTDVGATLFAGPAIAVDAAGDTRGTGVWEEIRNAPWSTATDPAAALALDACSVINLIEVA